MNKKLSTTLPMYVTISWAQTDASCSIHKCQNQLATPDYIGFIEVLVVLFCYSAWWGIEYNIICGECSCVCNLYLWATKFYKLCFTTINNRYMILFWFRLNIFFTIISDIMQYRNRKYIFLVKGCSSIPVLDVYQWLYHQIRLYYLYLMCMYLILCTR